jgi:hypothetical protein
VIQAAGLREPEGQPLGLHGLLPLTQHPRNVGVVNLQVYQELLLSGQTFGEMIS